MEPLCCHCRVRQLGQKQVAKQVVGNVIDRSRMEAAISDLGTHALEEGLTSAQACLSISVLGIVLVLHGLLTPRTAALHQIYYHFYYPFYY
jgi:hypothetical protein